MQAAANSTTTRPPMWLLAELTYRCPPHCVFCSNPVDYIRHRGEMDTATWKRVLGEARALGAVQLGFYTNLITSGVGLTEARAKPSAWAPTASNSPTRSTTAGRGRTAPP